MTLRRLAVGACGLALLLALPAARADVVLTGNHHTGDCDDAALGCIAFTPQDPVSRNQMFNYPTNFTLTTTTTIDKVTLENAVDLDGRFQVYIVARGASFVREMRAVEDGYRENSRELTLDEWLTQPLRSTVLDNLARLTSSLQ